MLFLLFGLLLSGFAQAQRPSNASTCDYYALARYGANTSTTQFQLVQGIVASAFGGKFNLSHMPSDLTGILTPGIFENLEVDLTPWFDGSIPSTNLNNAPVGLNWLDGGGIEPLYEYLSGGTENIVLKNGTNQELVSSFTVCNAESYADS